jgi:tRNA(Ile)-lysidine synthase TilS/MesJ
MVISTMAPKTAVCKNCALDSGIPGTTISSATGLCQFCEQFKQPPPEKGEEFKTRMDSIFTNPPKQGEYDAVLALSGGIDSCYALYRLKNEYPDLRILAVQFDNGFITETAFENARKFCELTESTYFRLSLDERTLINAFHLAAVSTDAFSGFAKYRASDICNTCMSIIKQKIIELAAQTKTPLIVFAFSPGQTDTPFIPLTKPFILWIRKMFESQLEAMKIKEKDLFLMDRAVTTSPGTAGVMIVHPFLIWDYNKELFRHEVKRLGWKEPNLKDPNTSNCLLNAFATKNHLEKYQIHSYAHDLSSLVRQGKMKRGEALKILNSKFSDSLVEKVRQKLAL